MILVHESGWRRYINPDKIELLFAIYQPDRQTSVTQITFTGASSDAYLRVDETPEQVMALINAWTYRFMGIQATEPNVFPVCAAWGLATTADNDGPVVLSYKEASE